jgi:pimeloyl-ACP methyl ester carboxylesterase
MSRNRRLLSQGRRWTNRLIWPVVLLVISALLHVNDGFALKPANPPAQPEAGPGGSTSQFVVGVAEEHGAMPTGYWLYEPGLPDGSLPTKPQPLVIFLHGYTAIDPEIFRPWIDHIVQNGAIVIYPFYQNANDLIIPQFIDNSVTAIHDALDELAKPGHVPVDLTRVGVVGHSVGGVLTADYAAIAAAEGLPVPSVIMPVEPAGCIDCNALPPGQGVPLEDFSTIPASVLAYLVVGNDDFLASEYGAKLIWKGMTAVPLENRDYIVVRSDYHGSPLLFADHGFPIAGPLPEQINALDWYGTWKLFDLLTECAFANTGCDQAFGGTEAQTFMGAWSDGTPVVPAIVTDDPALRT